MKRTPEQLAEWRQRLAAGETMEDIGAIQSPPITRQRVQAILAHKQPVRKAPRIARTVSLEAKQDAWLVAQAAKLGNKKVSNVVQALVEQAMAHSRIA